MCHEFEHAVVRDLYWAVSSPPLIRSDDTACRWYDSDWCAERVLESSDWFFELDRDADRLITLIEAENDKRLGRYFEILWAFWFENHPRYRVDANNLQLRDDQRTIGEMDLIVTDLETDTTTHIELAVKFYLGVGDTSSTEQWHGPGKRDRLDIKLETLLNRQTAISRRVLVKQQLYERGITIDECAVIMKGRLFYPWSDDAMPPESATADHLRGRWLRFSQLAGMDRFSFTPMQKDGWLAPRRLPGDDLIDFDELSRSMDERRLRLPLCAVRFEADKEAERFFIVPDEW